MNVVTLLNEKGGVGKTTLATHLAAGLALRGYRVVMVDSDPQGNATAALGLDKAPGFYDLCVRDANWRDVLHPIHPDVYSPPDASAAGQLFAVPSNNESRNIANSMRSRAIIRRRFGELDKVMHFIVVDTSPTPSLLNESVLLATDDVLIPTDTEAFSALEGVPDSIAHATATREATLEVGINAANLLGIIPNKFQAKTIGHREVLEHMRREYGELVWEPLKRSVVFSDAQLMQQFLFGFAPRAGVTQQIWNIVHRVEHSARQRQQQGQERENRP